MNNYNTKILISLLLAPCLFFCNLLQAAQQPKAEFAYKHGYPLEGTKQYREFTDPEKKELEDRLLELYENTLLEAQKPIVFVLGATRDGKSTTIGFALGADIICDGKDIAHKNPQEKNVPKIGDGYNSCTFGPAVYYREGLGIGLCDTEGYLGKRKLSMVEGLIAHQAPYFTLKQAHEIGGIVFVLGKDKLVDAGNGIFLECIKYLLEHFGSRDLRELKNSLLLVITKTRCEEEADDLLNDFAGYIEKFVKDAQEQQDLAHKHDMLVFLSILCKERGSDQYALNSPEEEKMKSKKTFPIPDDFEIDEQNILFVRPCMKTLKPEKAQPGAMKQESKHGRKKRQYEYLPDEDAREKLQKALKTLKSVPKNMLATTAFPVIKPFLQDLAGQLINTLNQESALQAKIALLKAKLFGEFGQQTLGQQIKQYSKNLNNLQQEQVAIKKDETLLTIYNDKLIHYNIYEKFTFAEATKDVVNFYIDQGNEVGSKVPVVGKPIGTLLGVSLGFVSALGEPLVYPVAYAIKGYLVREFIYNGGEQVHKLVLIATNGSFKFQDPSRKEIAKYFDFEEDTATHVVAVAKSPKLNPLKRYIIRYATDYAKSADASCCVYAKRNQLSSSITKVEALSKEILDADIFLKTLTAGKKTAEKDLAAAEASLEKINQEISTRWRQSHLGMLKAWLYNMFSADDAEVEDIQQAIKALENRFNKNHQLQPAAAEEEQKQKE